MNAVEVYLVGLGTVAVPWAGWVSLMLFKLNKDLGVSDARQDEQLHDHEERLNALEGLFPRTVRPS